MPQTFVQVGVQVVANVAVTRHNVQCFFVNNKLFFKAVTLRRLVVRIGNVAYCYTFRPMLRPNPVGVGQVNADCRRGIFVSTEHCRTHDVGCNATHFGLFKSRFDRRMVFKPLRIVTNKTCSARRLQVFILNNALPRSLNTQRIAINLDKSVDKIHVTRLLFKPFNRIFVKQMQVACAIITY